MADVREAILVRLKDILDALTAAPLSGLQAATRNRGLRENAQRPCLVLVDGSETADVTGERVFRPGVFRTQLMRMNPAIYILPKEERPTNVDASDVNVGTVSNGLRVQVCNAIATDAQLAALITSNGRVVFNGTETDLESGAAMSGEMKLDLSIVYPFNPTT